jgi:hypothetical protein
MATETSEIATAPTSSKGLYDLLTKEEEELMEKQHAVIVRAKDISTRIGKGIKMRDTQFLEDILPGVPNFSISAKESVKTSKVRSVAYKVLLDTASSPRSFKTCSIA